MDHCGGLAQFTEVHGYDGPIFMTFPTRAMIPPLLEDFRKINQANYDRRKAGEGDAESAPRFFSSADIAASLQKVTPVTAKKEIRVGDGITIRVWYASHVLGAGIWEVRVGPQTVVYSGDYNTVADRHLGAAYVPRLRPDLFISETTYSTSTRGQRRNKEREFLLKVHECVKRGGKVLIPVFALGRAQEVMLLIDSYWERMDLTVPVHYSKGLVSKANQNYTNYVGWMNQSVKETFTRAPIFDFRHIRPLEQKGSLDAPGPMVLFATPGMLHSGFSLEVFQKWCGSPSNLVVFTGYCAPGTPGDALIGGSRKVTLGSGATLDVACGIDSISFSAHVDAKGIVKMIDMVAPRNVMLVHGEKPGMDFLRLKIEKELGLYCCNPPNNYEVFFDSSLALPAAVSASLSKDVFVASNGGCSGGLASKRANSEVSAVAVLDDNDDDGDNIEGNDDGSSPNKKRKMKKVVRVLSHEAVGEELGFVEHKVRRGLQLPKSGDGTVEPGAAVSILAAIARELTGDVTDVKGGIVENEFVRVEYFEIDRVFHVSWISKHKELANELIANIIKPLILKMK